MKQITLADLRTAVEDQDYDVAQKNWLIPFLESAFSILLRGVNFVTLLPSFYQSFLKEPLVINIYFLKRSELLFN